MQYAYLFCLFLNRREWTNVEIFSTSNDLLGLSLLTDIKYHKYRKWLPSCFFPSIFCEWLCVHNTFWNRVHKIFFFLLIEPTNDIAISCHDIKNEEKKVNSTNYKVTRVHIILWMLYLCVDVIIIIIVSRANRTRILHKQKQFIIKIKPFNMDANSF